MEPACSQTSFFPNKRIPYFCEPTRGETLKEATPHLIASLFSMPCCQAAVEQDRAGMGGSHGFAGAEQPLVLFCICALPLASGSQNSQCLSFGEQLLPRAGKEASFYSFKQFVSQRIGRRSAHLNCNCIFEGSSAASCLQNIKMPGRQVAVMFSFVARGLFHPFLCLR